MLSCNCSILVMHSLGCLQTERNLLVHMMCDFELSMPQCSHARSPFNHTTSGASVRIYPGRMVLVQPRCFSSCCDSISKEDTANLPTEIKLIKCYLARIVSHTCRNIKERQRQADSVCFAGRGTQEGGHVAM